uniref:Putative 4-deoxy-4-formamido-L-arabinose-phosphoundecaprenol deformylase ArnD n=1 Tax=Lygus hesperus TaxID=30085 RepID=A0A0A9Z7L8_LYGHE
MTITLHSWPPEEWKTEVPEWTIEKCTLGDKEGVYDLLKRAFFKYEPLTCDLTDHPPMDDLFAIKMIDQGHSYKAVLPSGKIVGVVINVHFPDIPDDEEPPTSGRISQDHLADVSQNNHLHFGQPQTDRISSLISRTSRRKQ